MLYSVLWAHEHDHDFQVVKYMHDMYNLLLAPRVAGIIVTFRTFRMLILHENAWSSFLNTQYVTHVAGNLNFKMRFLGQDLKVDGI